MKKKISTGAYLLEYNNRKNQFGTIDASYDLSDKQEMARIFLRKEDLVNLLIEDNFVSFEMTLEQLDILSTMSRSVFESMNLLKILAKRDKLKDEAYFSND